MVKNFDGSKMKYATNYPKDLYVSEKCAKLFMVRKALKNVSPVELKYGDYKGMLRAT